VASTNATTAAPAADETLPGEARKVVDEVEFRSSLRWSGITLDDDPVDTRRRRWS
jgi:cation-transporting ATPase E